LIGGFSGKFQDIYHLIRMKGSTADMIAQDKVDIRNKKTLFPFNMPTFGDSENKQCMTFCQQSYQQYFFNAKTMKWKDGNNMRVGATS
jgi:hypothetical protein